MQLLSWFSILALLLFLGAYIYWSFHEESARPQWVRRSFYGGIILFSVLFLVLTWHTLIVLPQRTNAEALTAQVVAGKHVWHKYVCVDCHTLLGNGAYYAPDLTKTWNRFLQRAGGNDNTAKKLMAAYLKSPPQPTAKKRGMPKFPMTNEEAENLVDFLGWISRIDTNGWPPEPVRPVGRRLFPEAKHRSPLTERGEHLINDYGCMDCHSFGSEGVEAPDLIASAARYDRNTLALWIRSPESVYRQSRQKPLNPGYAEMPNLDVSKEDAEAMAAYLFDVAGEE